MGLLVWDACDAVGAITTISALPRFHTFTVRKQNSGTQNSVDRIGSVLERLRDDTLLLLSEHDEMVLREMGERLWAGLQVRI